MLRKKLYFYIRHSQHASDIPCHIREIYLYTHVHSPAGALVNRNINMFGITIFTHMQY